MPHKALTMTSDPSGSCLYVAGSPTDNAKTSEIYILVKSPAWWQCGRCRQRHSDFLLQWAYDIEADHSDSGIVIDSADRNRQTPHLGD